MRVLPISTIMIEYAPGAVRFSIAARTGSDLS